MKRTMIAAVIGGFLALTAGAFTAQAAPVAAIQAGKSAQSGEQLAQKAGWRHRHRHYRHRHYRRHHWHSHRRHYRRYHAHRHHWRHHRHHRHSHRYYRRHYH